MRAWHAPKRTRYTHDTHAAAQLCAACSSFRLATITLRSLLLTNAAHHPFVAQEVAYCAKNGWKQQIHCVEARSNTTQSYLDAESTSYYTYQACPVSFNSFVRFELLMLLGFVFAFCYVQRRKRRLHALQQFRIASY